MLRCIWCHGVDVMRVIIAVCMIVHEVLISVCCVGCGGLSRYTSLLGWLYCCAVHVCRFEFKISYIYVGIYPHFRHYTFLGLSHCLLHMHA
jgi:hypothetical protein